MAEFPSLPPVGQLVHEDVMWSYRFVHAGGGLAHLRVWNAEPGHLMVVTELGMGASITNSAEHIWAALLEQFGEPLVMLEHYPPSKTMSGEGVSLDQVVVVDGDPHWRSVWPTPPDNPMHEQFTDWMRAYGFTLPGGDAALTDPR